jgi:cobalt-zinc-cadmium efflux system membrane fusion protein
MISFRLLLLVIFLIFNILCKKVQSQVDSMANYDPPKVQEGGKFIEFSSKHPQLALFSYSPVRRIEIDIDLKAPATVIGKVKNAERIGGQPLVLFASPELTGTYSAYIQNLLSIQVAKTNYNRTKDLYEHGASTGKELNDTSTELFARETNLAENEAKLRREGFSPGDMKGAKSGTVWLVSDLPETEINVLRKGLKCKLEFPSLPGESFDGTIEALAEVLNIETRKARTRIILLDKDDKIRPGMYGKVKFQVSHNGLMVPKNSVFSYNARYYVFIKKTNTLFERREVEISSETDELIEIERGLEIEESIVDSNVILLKGLSIGI